MAKLTGQFTTPSLDVQNNKTHKPFLHGVVFVFTGTTKVTRETDAKGKYSFDLANGEYEVSVYLKGNTEKDRFDMRAGEKFTVTATTQADALEKWLQVIGTSGKDELATYYENLLAQMQKVANDFKKDTEFVGSGKIVREMAVMESCNANGGIYVGGSTPVNFDTLSYGNFGLYAVTNPDSINPPKDFRGESGFRFLIPLNSYKNGPEIFQWGLPFRAPAALAWRTVNGYASGEWVYSRDTSNTTIDSNGFIKAASPIIKLFNDRIEHSGFGDSEPIFEKLSIGTYKISNTLGLAQEGWTYEKPRGNDGQPYFRIVVEKLEDGCIVRVHDEYDTVEKAEITDIDGNTRTVDKIVKILGQARDIKEHERWIDLRFHEEPEEHQAEESLAEY